MTEQPLIEVDWSRPFKLNGVRCFLAKDGEEWLIATADAPKFCFSGTSKVDAIEKAKRGIEFWQYAKAKASHDGEAVEDKKP